MRIALVGLSGIRACDEELLALGMSMPGLAKRAGDIASMPSLGLLTIAACTPPGHELRYLELSPGASEPADLHTYDLIAISALTAQAQQAYALAARLRASGACVALGGLHVTALPKEAARHADHVVVGEGEQIWPRLVEAVARGEGGRIWRATDFPPVDIAAVPTPRYDLLPQGRHGRLTVQSTRGCPWRCAFCASTVMLGRPYRKRPVEQVVRDVLAARSAGNDPFIEFADDNTFVDRRWGKDLCRALLPHDLRWFTPTDISVADDPELLDLMARSGCRQVLIGLESPQAASLAGLQAGGFKAARLADYAAAVRRIQSHGITVNGCFVLGFDEDDPTIFARVLEAVGELGLYDVQITVLTPFPGSPFYDRMVAEGRLLDDAAWQRYTLFDVTFRPAQMSPAELRAGMYWLAERLYAQPRPDTRRRRFRRVDGTAG